MNYSIQNLHTEKKTVYHVAVSFPSWYYFSQLRPFTTQRLSTTLSDLCAYSLLIHLTHHGVNGKYETGNMWLHLFTATIVKSTTEKMQFWTRSKFKQGEDRVIFWNEKWNILWYLAKVYWGLEMAYEIFAIYGDFFQQGITRLKKTHKRYESRFYRPNYMTRHVKKYQFAVMFHLHYYAIQFSTRHCVSTPYFKHIQTPQITVIKLIPRRTQQQKKTAFRLKQGWHLNKRSQTHR